MYGKVLVYYLQNWVIRARAHVGVHIPAPWFAYGVWPNIQQKASKYH